MGLDIPWISQSGYFSAIKARNQVKLKYKTGLLRISLLEGGALSSLCMVNSSSLHFFIIIEKRKKVAQSCLTLCDPRDCNMSGFPYPSPTPRACSNSCPWSRWCPPTISSSVVPFSCLRSFPVSGSFQMSQFFASDGQSIGASASGSVLPVNTQGWFPLGLTGLISLQSKELSRVFSNTMVQKFKLLTVWVNSSQT